MNYKLPPIPYKEWSPPDALALSGLCKVGGRIARHTLMHHTTAAQKQLLEGNRQTVVIGQLLTLI